MAKKKPKRHDINLRLSTEQDRTLERDFREEKRLDGEREDTWFARRLLREAIQTRRAARA